MAYSEDKTPDFVVSAGVRNGDRKSYVRVGMAYHAESGKGKRYISVRLQAKPWENWDGTLYLNENTTRQPGEDEVPL